MQWSFLIFQNAVLLIQDCILHDQSFFTLFLYRDLLHITQTKTGPVLRSFVNNLILETESFPFLEFLLHVINL